MASLTTSGTPTANGNSTVTIDSTGSDRVRAPLSLINATQGWFAARLVAASIHVDSRRVFSWRPDGNNWIELYQGSTAQSGFWRFQRRAAGTGVEAQDGNNDTGDFTVVGKWTATEVGISGAGAAFSLQGNTNIPTFSGSYFDIGRLGDQVATGWLNSTLYWCAAGTGTLTDADAAVFNDFGNTDPAWGSIPGTPTFLWTCDDFTYQDSAPSVTAARVRVVSSGLRW